MTCAIWVSRQLGTELGGEEVERDPQNWVPTTQGDFFTNGQGGGCPVESAEIPLGEGSLHLGVKPEKKAGQETLPPRWTVSPLQ